MTPVAHAGLGWLAWELAAKRKTAGTLALFLAAANLADLDLLFFLVFGRRPIAVHQYYTHNLFFVVAATGLLALLLLRGRDRLGLVLAGLSHLAADLLVVDLRPPFGIRLFYPLSSRLYYLGIFPFARRGSWRAVVSWRNAAVLGLEAAVFILPVLLLFGPRLWRRMKEKGFWTLGLGSRR